MWLRNTLIIAFLTVCRDVSGDIGDDMTEAIQLCCNAGTADARNQTTPDCSAEHPLPSKVPAAFNTLCIIARSQCCKEYTQKKRDCENGIDIGISTKRCDSTSGSTKVCCGECVRGKNIGLVKGFSICDVLTRGNSAEELLADDAYAQCCKNGAQESNRSMVHTNVSPESIGKIASLCEDYAPTELCAHHCIPVPGSYKCECNPGFMLMADGRNCKEVIKNRCRPRNPCQHKCNDNGITVKCSCRRGYELMPDGKSCKDIDECQLDLSICLPGTKCFNTRGSYKCVPVQMNFNREGLMKECPPGFFRNIYKDLCDDINECKLPKPPCPVHVCENTVGGYKCDGVSGDPVNLSSTPMTPEQDKCPQGFKFGHHGECEDMDECVSHEDDCNPLSQFCINTHGSFHCQDMVSKHCPPGFKINEVNGRCEDINECEDDTEICRSDQDCINQLGRYDCKSKVSRFKSNQQCPDGMRNNSKVCEDINECLEGTHLCDQHQNCLNTNGSYECHCKVGYELDVTTSACIDMNECATGQHNCIIGSQRCDNTVGSFLCIRITSCGTGYILHHSTGTCEDIDECALGTHNCARAGPEYQCINIPGSFRCVRRRTSTTSTTALPEYEYVYYDIEDGENPEEKQTVAVNNLDNSTPSTTTTSTSTTELSSSSTQSIQPSSPSPSPSSEIPTINIPTHPSPDEDINSIIPPPNYNEPIQPDIFYSEPKSTTTESRPLTIPVTTVTPIPATSQPEPSQSEPSKFEPNTETPKPEPPKTEYPELQSPKPTEPEPTEPGIFYSEPKTDISSTTTTHEYITDSEPKSNLIPYEPRYPEPTITYAELKPDQDISTNFVPYEIDKDTTYEKTSEKYPYSTESGKPIYPHTIFVDVSKDAPTVEGKRTSDGSVVIDANSIPENEWTKVSVKPISCPHGYEPDEYGACFDVDECFTNRHTCYNNTEVCKNTVGGYICNCAPGYTKYNDTGFCTIITTSSTSTSTSTTTSTTTTAPTTSEKNFFWSYPDYRPITTRPFRPRNPCDVGFYLDQKTGTCEDINECTNGQADCAAVEICVNTQGGYKCECPPNWSLDDVRHRCVPIRRHGLFPPGYGNEPPHDSRPVVSYTSKPPESPVSPKVTHVDDRGRVFKCPWGYRLGIDNVCEDINECVTGEARCGPLQICTNLPGGYTCSCPNGHRLAGDHECEDVDECDLAGKMMICSRNADCINTIGSYQCKCHNGFRPAPVNNKVCVDVDECTESNSRSLCQHRCNNVWGGYRCSCYKGYRLNIDNKTCSDIDECSELKSKMLCIGRCHNEPGRYRCSCPRGYRLSEDKRSCIDIDECETGEATCAKSGIFGSTSYLCFNTRGSYRCPQITCPPGYRLENKHRCSKAGEICRLGDWECAHKPTTISYNFITFVSKLYIPASTVNLFTMRGPTWPNARIKFQLKLVEVDAPPTVKDKADINTFLLSQNNNEGVMSLGRPLEGPQSIKLDLIMELYNNGQFGGIAVAKIFIYVSDYEF
ncbi:fibrillin-1 [Bombyx mori]|uniref:EGF-like domain-containing protein n=1 Tax=Bombyx mori TaxID=7091 RepID=A0A8R2R9B0_BOMMO|nr:fibrillin-1 [Bombyx mori]